MGIALAIISVQSRENKINIVVIFTFWNMEFFFKNCFTDLEAVIKC